MARNGPVGDEAELHSLRRAIVRGLAEASGPMGHMSGSGELPRTTEDTASYKLEDAMKSAGLGGAGVPGKWEERDVDASRTAELVEGLSEALGPGPGAADVAALQRLMANGLTRCGICLRSRIINWTSLGRWPAAILISS